MNPNLDPRKINWNTLVTPTTNVVCFKSRVPSTHQEISVKFQNAKVTQFCSVTSSPIHVVKTEIVSSKRA